MNDMTGYVVSYSAHMQIRSPNWGIHLVRQEIEQGLRGM